MAQPRVIHIGDRYGRLTIVADSDRRSKDRCRFYRWECDCGATGESSSKNLRAGDKQSCGCLNDEKRRLVRRTHGLYQHPMYELWEGMIQRCTNPNARSYSNYGGRGITVCQRWREFPNFLADMGERPEGLTLDRIDNDGNYEPDNCRWTTYSEQNKNRRLRPVAA